MHTRLPRISSVNPGRTAPATRFTKCPGKAIKGICQVVKDAVADMQANGEAVPIAIAERKFSGEFKLCIPLAKHRELVIHAAEQGVSLNRYINALI